MGTSCVCVCGVRYENVVFNTNSDSYSLATCLFNLFVVCVRFCVVVVVVVFTLLVFVCRLKINCPFSLPLALCCSSVECRLDEQFIMIFTTHENITFYVVWRLHTHTHTFAPLNTFAKCKVSNWSGAISSGYCFQLVE